MRVQACKAATTGATSVSPVFASNVTTGNMILVAVTAFSNATIAVTDTLSNTYTQIGTYKSLAGGYYLSLWMKANTAGGACTITVTGASSNYFTVAAMEYDNTPASPLDSSATNTGSSTTLTTGSVTVSGSNELIIGVMAWTGGDLLIQDLLLASGSIVCITTDNIYIPLIVIEAIVSSSQAVSVVSSIARAFSAIGASFTQNASGGGGGLFAPGGFDGGFERR